MLLRTNWLSHRPFTAREWVRVPPAIQFYGLLGEWPSLLACHARDHGFESRTYRNCNVRKNRRPTLVLGSASEYSRSPNLLLRCNPHCSLATLREIVALPGNLI